jgi:nicotinamidase-related amidase
MNSKFVDKESYNVSTPVDNQNSEQKSKQDCSTTRTGGYGELKWNAEPLYCPHPSASSASGISIPIACSSPAGCTSSNELSNDPLETQTQIPLLAGKTALLIVDVQPEYWSSCPSVRKDFPDFETNLARTIQTARERRCKIIWVRADYRRETSPWLVQFERLSRNKRPDALIELPCDPDDEEFGWEPFATPEGGDAIITKTSWSSTTNTALIDLLRSSAIDTVLVCGLITSVCVQHSAFGVFEAGYRTLLVEDACGDRGRARHEAALALYGGYMYELIRSDELADPNNERGLKQAEPSWITVGDLKQKNGRKHRGRSKSPTSENDFNTDKAILDGKKRKISIEETYEKAADGKASCTVKRSKSTVSIISITD